ncbi:MAG: putative toxin-antitoxin system toxin component, PIN family [Roseofilum sp. Guam]|nr:putative toxin-antitoxin system toxin component, PIN family [Roseofilum sp. Guam]
MINEMRYVFDTNIIVSALLFEYSKPDRVLRYALANGEVLLSLELLEELSEIFGREKFNRYITREEREQFLGTLVARSALVEIVEQVAECRDRKDDKILELALNGEASYIITGDRDLLVLHPFRGILVITADEFLRTIAPE